MVITEMLAFLVMGLGHTPMTPKIISLLRVRQVLVFPTFTTDFIDKLKRQLVLWKLGISIPDGNGLQIIMALLALCKIDISMDPD